MHFILYMHLYYTVSEVYPTLHNFFTTVLPYDAGNFTYFSVSKVHNQCNVFDRRTPSVVSDPFFWVVLINLKL